MQYDVTGVRRQTSVFGLNQRKDTEFTERTEDTEKIRKKVTRDSRRQKPGRKK